MMIYKYFNHNEVNEILNAYTEKYRNDKVKKIEYSTWCELKRAPNGIVVKYQNKNEDIEVYTAQDEKSVEIDEWIDDFAYSEDFGKWFYDNHLINDYITAVNYNYNPIDITISKNISNSIVSTESYLNQHIEKRIDEEMNKYLEKEKEKDSMKGFNFDFGPCTNDAVKMSMYGIAVKNQAGEWVSYNQTTGQIVNVDIFNFDGGKYMFKMPVSPSQVETGNVIIHNKKAMFVLEKDENGFVVVDPHAGEEKKVVPTSNCFNFNFIIKVVSLFDFDNMGTPTVDNPFGNMWLFALMSENKEFNVKDMIMLSMMSSGNNTSMMNNPMMLMMLMDEKNDVSDLLIPMMMMNQNIVNQKN